jgi:hypothetical protein
MATAWKAAQLGVASILVLGLCAGAFSLLRHQSRLPSVSGVARQDASATARETSGVAPEPAAATVRIDLTQLSQSRGTEGTARQATLELEKGRLRALVQMPLGMEPGEYLVRIEDSAGAVRAETRAQGKVTNGSTSIEVELDLRAAAIGKAILMVRPPGLSWRRFPVLIK